MARGVVWQGPSRLGALVVAAGCLAATSLGLPSAAHAAGPQVKGTIWGDAKADKVSTDTTTDRYSAVLDPGSLFTVTTAIGARDVWTEKDPQGRAVTGQGVTVAVLDSGVEAVPSLNGVGKTVFGPDLSLETNSDALTGHDTFGHGTHMAGIIAAKDPVKVDPKTGTFKADPAKQFGVAPDAQLLALKLATTDGSTDVSEVIAALDWVAQHRFDNGMNVRVVNLSYGTATLQPYQIDPLAAAAEHAWKRGLVVVVSGGNGGANAGSLTDPAIDPYVIAVGASDPAGTTAGWKAPVVADFSSVGTAARHVDLLAPGRSITALRAPGSFIDVQHPEGRVAGDTTGRLFRGSGTSQATAVVSGAAALVLQANPNLTPDQVKDLLVKTARPLTGATSLEQGAGQVDVAAAVSAAMDVKAGTTAARQVWEPATGLGSLDAARGDNHLVNPDTGDVLSGEVDILGTPWDAAAWSTASANGTSWNGGIWMTARWAGDSWTSTDWATARWATARWANTAWATARWADATWDTARWATARWANVTWDTARWASSTYS